MRIRILGAIIGTFVLGTSSIANADPALFEGCLLVDETLLNAGGYVDNGDGTFGCIDTDGDVAGLGADGLGTIIVTVADEGAHSVGLYVDHEIDEEDNTFFNEYGDTSGATAAGQSWEIDDPEAGDIVGNFFGYSLDNTNGAPQGGCTNGDFDDVDAGECHDVAMAMFWDFVLAAGETATISFLIGDTAPGGFYLEQVDPESGSSIFFSSTLRIRGPVTEVPEPGTLLLLGAGLLGMAASRRRNRKGAN